MNKSDKTKIKQIFGLRADAMIEILNKELYRHCSHCDETKSADELYSRRHECKLCRSERSKSYYEKNKEKFHDKYVKSKVK